MKSMEEIYIRQLQLGPMLNFVYLIGSQATREVAVIDPAWEVAKILEVAQRDEVKITHILLTHFHFDHTNGISELLEKVSAKVYIHKEDADYLDEPPSEMVKVDSGDILSVGGLKVELLHAPGHTPGSQCFLVQSHLISGDTLFIGGCGRCDGPGGDPEEMYRSLSRLKKLDKNTLLMPGHNYGDRPTSTIAHEMEHNPFLRIGSLQTFLKWVPGPFTFTTGL